MTGMEYKKAFTFLTRRGRERVGETYDTQYRAINEVVHGVPSNMDKMIADRLVEEVLWGEKYSDLTSQYHRYKDEGNLDVYQRDVRLLNKAIERAKKTTEAAAIMVASVR